MRLDAQLTIVDTCGTARQGGEVTDTGTTTVGDTPLASRPDDDRNYFLAQASSERHLRLRMLALALQDQTGRTFPPAF
ncbi:hypothetical protein GCM10025771_30800 [Niveibacterium umoris]|uniref:Uncharacterized protein n=1 Tax=Niveibacterium umoris TaxID=1193620 RepID=A0A840BML5_9RHOO|nr:hypothetical protein [Niveibacterium umoris]MBB4011727.1 hypothetical protein [Niveibacterium umoris]